MKDIDWIKIKGNNVRVAWRTKTTRQQLIHWLNDVQIDYLKRFIETGNLGELGDILNVPNKTNKHSHLVVAEILWAMTRGKKITPRKTEV